MELKREFWGRLACKWEPRTPQNQFHKSVEEGQIAQYTLLGEKNSLLIKKNSIISL